MPRKKKNTKYLVQLTASVEVETSFELEASSEKEAIALAQEKLEDNLSISDLPGSGDISVSVSSFDTISCEEQD